VPAETPLARLLARGAASLSDPELLAVVVDSEGGIEMRDRIRKRLTTYDLQRFLIMNRGQLQRLLDISSEQAARLVAVRELAARIARETLPIRCGLTLPPEIVTYLHLRYGDLEQERAGALFLDHHNRLLSDREFFCGSRERTPVDPGIILREALLAAANGIILFHTHPSGDPRPSTEDWDLTRQMDIATRYLGLRLVDHVIVGGPTRGYSFRLGRRF
jgi:DNA repair protein RadC